MDYNQMLVVSVVLHLLAIVVIMFLPKPKIMQKRIIPSFNFEVIEIPFQRMGEPKEPKAETVKPRVEPPPSEETEVKEAKPVAPPPVQKVEKHVTPLPVKKAEVPKPKVPAPKPVEKKVRLPEKPAPAIPP